MNIEWRKKSYGAIQYYTYWPFIDDKQYGSDGKDGIYGYHITDIPDSMLRYCVITDTDCLIETNDFNEAKRVAEEAIRKEISS